MAAMAVARAASTSAQGHDATNTASMFTAVDHISFPLGPVLISRRVWDPVFVVTGLTIGHSLTLALAVAGVVRMPDISTALAALTIAPTGAENIVVQSKRQIIPLGAGLSLVLVATLRGSAGATCQKLLLLGARAFRH
jgi:hypothetical protein